MTCFTPVKTEGIAVWVFFQTFFVSVLVFLILMQPQLQLFLERVL